jgi:hypothetical protein
MFNRKLDARIWFAQILGKFWWTYPPASGVDEVSGYLRQPVSAICDENDGPLVTALHDENDGPTICDRLSQGYLRLHARYLKKCFGDLSAISLL